MEFSTQIRQGYRTGDPWSEVVDFVRAAEQMGIRTVWAPEAWNHDALTPLGYLAACTDRIRLGTGIVQVGSRSPALVAMSALTLAEMSGDRFVLGLGVSGPQVMESWHGVQFERPLTRLREMVEIVRLVCAGEYLEYSGDVYQLPLAGRETKRIRTFLTPRTIPIYLATIGPKALDLTGELADGWAGSTFIPELADKFLGPMAEGAARSGRGMADVDLQVAVRFYAHSDEGAALAEARRDFAFSAGAMGSAATNFYNRSYVRLGFGNHIENVQKLWRAGDREGAAAAVPEDLVRMTHILGDEAAVKERLRAYAAAGVATLNVKPVADTYAERIDALGTIVDLGTGMKH